MTADQAAAKTGSIRISMGRARRAGWRRAGRARSGCFGGRSRVETTRGRLVDVPRRRSKEPHFARAQYRTRDAVETVQNLFRRVGRGEIDRVQHKPLGIHRICRRLTTGSICTILIREAASPSGSCSTAVTSTTRPPGSVVRDDRMRRPSIDLSVNNELIVFAPRTASTRRPRTVSVTGPSSASNSDAFSEHWTT